MNKTKIRRFLEKSIVYLLVGFIFTMGVIQFYKYMEHVWYEKLVRNKYEFNVTVPRTQEIAPQAMIRRIWGKDTYKVAIAVFMAESGLRCDAVSSTNDHGIAQLHNQPIYDCYENLIEAKKKYDRFEEMYGNGWLAWSAWKNGNYLKYLN